MAAGQWQIEVRERSLIRPEGSRQRLASSPLFFLLAYLAYQRTIGPPEGGWCGIGEIARLPAWREHSEESIGKEIQRYLRGGNHYPIAFGKVSRGPYRFAASRDQIAFDVDLPEVASLLELSREPEPSAEAMDAPRRLSVITFVRALAQAEGTRGMGCPRSEYLEALAGLRGTCQDSTLPLSLRILGFDRILDLEFYAHHSAQILPTLREAEQLVETVTDPSLGAWAKARMATHRLRLLLQKDRYQDARAGAAQAIAASRRQGDEFDSRTVADLYNTLGLARSRLARGNPAEAVAALGLLFRALELRLMGLSLDEVHGSCLNVGTCLANDLGDIRWGLQWLAAAEVVREACGIAQHSGLQDFAIVSLVRRFPGPESPLRSPAVRAFLQGIGLMADRETSVEQFVEERLASGFKRSQDFDDRRSLLVGYRARIGIRFLQRKWRQVFTDVLRFRHLAQQLGEDVREHPPHVPEGSEELVAAKLRDWEAILAEESDPVEEVPEDALADYVDELESWIEKGWPQGR